MAAQGVQGKRPCPGSERNVDEDDVDELTNFFTKEVKKISDRHGNFSGKTMRKVFEYSGFQCTEKEIDLLIDDLRYFKGNNVHYTELIEYMTSPGLSNWLNSCHVTEINESLQDLRMDHKKKGAISIGDLEKAFITHLPDHIANKEEVEEMLTHLPPQYLEDGYFHFEAYMSRMIRNKK